MLADITANVRRGPNASPISPLALDAVERIDRLFDIERTITGLGIDERLVVRQAQSAPLVAELEAWMRTESQRLSKHAEVARAMSYMLRRWEGFTRFLQDGRACLSNNAAERALRGISLGRKSWLFAGSEMSWQHNAAVHISSAHWVRIIHTQSCGLWASRPGALAHPARR